MSATPEATPPRRRRFGLPVWGLMVVVLAVGLVLGWAKHRIRTQREAVEAVRRSGGTVRFDYDKELFSGIKPGGPDWLRRWVGRDDSIYLMNDVLRVTFDRHEKADAPVDDALPYLARFSKLEELDLHERLVSGSSLRHVRGLRSLEQLEGVLTSLSDGDLAHLSSLKRLRGLDLGVDETMESEIDDAGLRHIAELTELESLCLSSSRVTDAGLARLSKFTKLKSIYLDRSRVTDKGLVHLAGLANLEDLSLRGTKITDEGLSHLVSLTKLKYLYLSGTSITDAGMVHLTRLRSLEALELTRTSVGDAGIMRLKPLTKLIDLGVAESVSRSVEVELQKTLPNVTVYFGICPWDL